MCRREANKREKIAQKLTTKGGNNWADSDDGSWMSDSDDSHDFSKINLSGNLLAGKASGAARITEKIGDIASGGRNDFRG